LNQEGISTISDEHSDFLNLEEDILWCFLLFIILSVDRLDVLLKLFGRFTSVFNWLDIVHVDSFHLVNIQNVIRKSILLMNMVLTRRTLNKPHTMEKSAVLIIK